MAFISKVGSILRQIAKMQISPELSSFKLSIHQAIRCMSSMPSPKLYIEVGISYQTDEQSLREAFAKYGQVQDARIIGFVTYASTEECHPGLGWAGGGCFGDVTDVGCGGGGYGGGGSAGNYGGSGGDSYTVETLLKVIAGEVLSVAAILVLLAVMVVLMMITLVVLVVLLMIPLVVLVVLRMALASFDVGGGGF